MKRILAVAAVALVAVVAIWHPPATAPLAQVSAPPASPHPRRAVGASPSAVVYVAGAVRRPGLYHLSNGARADDAVLQAGGLRGDADAERINLAERVADGQEVDVPTLGAPTPRSGHQRKNKAAVPKSAAPIDPLDINAATADELAAVPGIGKTIAARIVEVRERDGAYQSLDDLLDVAGMTASRLARAERYLHI